LKLKRIVILLVICSLIRFDIVQADENKYLIFNEAMTWSEARDYCLNLGGHLVTITSAEEQNVINELISQEEHPMNLYWIGLSLNENREWKWENNEPYTFSNWSSGEPNQDFYNTEFYTQIYGKNYDKAHLGEWNDARNNGGSISFYLLANTGFICEFENYEEDNGFSSVNDGWPILNSAICFGYKEPYYLDLSAYFIKGTRPNVSSVINGIASRFKKWGGSCFGLSLLAVANYNDQINLNSYFDNKQGSLNSIGYNKIVSVKSGKLYSIEGNESLIKTIERAQASQVSSSILDTEVFKWDTDFTNLISYLSSDDARPLIACFPTPRGGHSVVIETSSKPIDHGDGRYTFLCYDCNAPQLSIPLENACNYYNCVPSYITVDNSSKRWWYFYHDKVEASGNFVQIGFSFKSLRFFDVSKLSEEYFYGKPLSFLNSKNTLYYFSSNLEITNKDSIWLKVENDMLVNGTSDIDYYSYCDEDIINESRYFNRGFIITPIAENTLISSGNTFVFRACGDCFAAYMGDGNSELTIDDQTLGVNLKNTDSQTECNYKLILGNLDKEKYAVAEGVLNGEEQIMLKAEDIDLSAFTSETTSNKNNVYTYTFENNKIQEENFHIQTTSFKRNIYWIIYGFVLFVLTIIMAFTIRKRDPKVK